MSTQASGNVLYERHFIDSPTTFAAHRMKFGTSEASGAMMSMTGALSKGLKPVVRHPLC